MATWKTFEDIDIWQSARLFCHEVFKILHYDGLKNDFALKDQINRSSGSIMDNIAEGYGRDGKKEFINFLSISKGSANESLSQLHRIYDRQYISQEEYEKLNKDIREIINKLGGLIAYLKKSEFKGIKYK